MSSGASNTLRAGRATRSGRGEQLVSGGTNITPRSEGIPHPARRVHRTPLGGYTALRSEGTPHPARRVHRTPLGGYTAPRSEGTPHSARRVHHSPLGGYITVRSEGISHSERDGQLCLIPVINNFRPGKKSLAFSV